MAELQAGVFPCYHLYECADHRYLSLCCVEPDFWHRLCRHFDREDWLTEQFAGPPVRREMFEFFHTTFATRPQDSWVQELTGAGLPVAPVNRGAGVIEDPHLRARGSIREVELPSAARMWQIMPGLRSDAIDVEVVRGVTVAGADSRQILTELGRGPEEIDELVAQGIVTQDV
jgi:crotonobetainyl-CoA:carnitine CoA-transferase CaiB-like acyl-CoA transferase